MQLHVPNISRGPTTLLRTPKTSPIVELRNEHYILIGFDSSTKRQLLKAGPLPEVVSEQLNCDGRTVFLPSNVHLWPVLGRVKEPIRHRTRLNYRLCRWLKRIDAALNDLRFNQESIVRGFDGQLVANEGVCYQATRAFDLNDLSKIKQNLSVTGNFNATVGRPWLSIKFQVHALKRCVARGVGTTVRRMLTTITGEKLILQCNWLVSGERTAVSTHLFVGAFIGLLIQLLTSRCCQISYRILGRVDPGYWKGNQTDARGRDYGKKVRRYAHCHVPFSFKSNNVRFTVLGMWLFSHYAFRLIISFIV